MLSSEIKHSLNQYFSKLTTSIQLVCFPSESSQQGELEELLQATADCHESVEFILAQVSVDTHSDLYFEIHRQGVPTGISFRGIPTGHEFNSFILAILHSDHQGELPDSATIQRIQSLKGPIELKTFISLSCTNCPLVVQALNLMATFHPDFQHQMVDGSSVSSERDRLGVQSVPSVYCGDQLIHAGRGNLAELIAVLVKHFGLIEGAPSSPKFLGDFDLVVIGGGPSGISSAIYGSRKGLKTALIAETLGGQLQETVGIENFISVIYTEGAQLATNLVAHIKEYPVTLFEHRKLESVEMDQTDSSKKRLRLSSQETLRARALIIATGARWRELGVKGEKQYLGKGVAYCPHCDGPYFKGKDVIVVGGGNSGIEAALDLAGIVKSVTVFEFQKELKADKALIDVLRSRNNIKVITSAALQTIEGDGSQVSHVTYINSENLIRGSAESFGLTPDSYPTSAVFVQIGLLPNSQCVRDLVELNGAGEIVIDEKNRTSASGIYATGDVTNIPYKQIIISMGEGAKAALAVHEDSMLVEGS